VTVPARPGVSPTRWLAAFVLSVLVLHHLGALSGPLGTLGAGTRWIDWVDLVTPYAVVGTALLALRAQGAPPGVWVLAILGAVLYVQGHGIHLAANSIGNARGDAAPVHLWDEVVGHYLWYAGLALIVLALALSVTVPTGPLAQAAAVAFGWTQATNGIEGGTAWASIAVAAAFVVAFRYQRTVVLAYASALAVLVGWGTYWALAEGRSFPQPSDLGWL
jgi:hypothetical protein